LNGQLYERKKKGLKTNVFPCHKHSQVNHYLNEYIVSKSFSDKKLIMSKLCCSLCIL